MKLTVLIAEDERLAREELVYMLSKEPDLELLEPACSGKEAVEAVLARRPDAVFLDVEMPEMTGLQAARALMESGHPPPLFVFTTAYDHYAVDAFGVEAVDYLLKPYDEERLRQALRRLRERMQRREEHPGAGHAAGKASADASVEAETVVKAESHGGFDRNAAGLMQWRTPAAERPVSEENSAEQPGSGTTSAQQPGAGISSAEQPVSRTTAAEQSDTGITRAEQPGTGTTAAEQPSSRTSAAGHSGTGTTDAGIQQQPIPSSSQSAAARRIRLLIEDGGRMVVLDGRSLLFAVKEDKLTRIRMADGSEYTARQTLQELEERLGAGFFRPHRSYLVNLDYIREIQPWFNGAYNAVLRHAEEMTIPVSRSAAKEMLRLLEEG